MNVEDKRAETTLLRWRRWCRESVAFFVVRCNVRMACNNHNNVSI